jgi:hypothetical protein
MPISHGMRHATALVCLLASSQAAAISPCFEEPGTRATTCIDGSRVRSNGSLRASTVYKGGPKGVHALPYQMIADCKRSVLVLQDESGVNFGGGKFDATPVATALGLALCRAAKTVPDKSLQQF